MVKWEYLVYDDKQIQIDGFVTLKAWLDSVGKDGWELVTIKKNKYIFKRSKITFLDKKWEDRPTTVTWYYDNEKYGDSE